MHNLEAHPAGSDTPNLVISADASVTRGSLMLKYQILALQDGAGDSDKVLWNAAPKNLKMLSSSLRRDELWKSTCLEAFILFDSGNYIELNLSPEGTWNVYKFDSYRAGMAPHPQITELYDFGTQITKDDGREKFRAEVRLDLSSVLKSPQNFRLGLTAVVETLSGQRSYWSLKHASEKPDFHDSRGHILEMRI